MDFNDFGEKVLDLFVRDIEPDGNGSLSNNSSLNGTGHHGGHAGHVNSGTVLFLFMSFAVGGKTLSLLLTN